MNHETWERLNQRLRSEGLLSGTDRWEARYAELYDEFEQQERRIEWKARWQKIDYRLASFMNIMAWIPAIVTGIVVGNLWGVGPGIVIGILVWILMARVLRDD